jgi:hypothetical protein
MIPSRHRTGRSSHVSSWVCFISVCTCDARGVASCYLRPCICGRMTLFIKASYLCLLFKKCGKEREPNEKPGGMFFIFDLFWVQLYTDSKLTGSF